MDEGDRHWRGGEGARRGKTPTHAGQGNKGKTGITWESARDKGGLSAACGRGERREGREEEERGAGTGDTF